MLGAKLRPIKKPDADNVLKIIADSLNGIACHDDSQIVSCEIHKYYGEIPQFEYKENIEQSVQKTGSLADF
ncbi:MAG: RusA family crossover junction endodeoxyribonuclease [Ruminococcus flavefaciens]|nr:RusA family crossover junction endodeoxyribonuclease [Ruminococcus flavefaciens]MCM1062371.1 RusA family crossover junction endodeoxyribonuclease [Eubacterium sp.]